MSLVKKYSTKKGTCKVTFSLPKEAVQNGKDVVLLGEFNNWNPQEGIALVNKKNEYQTVIELAAGRKYEYRYLVDGCTWVNDFQADAYVPNVFGTENSVVAVPKPAKKIVTKKVVAKTTAKAAPKKTVKKVTAKKATPKKAVAKKATKVVADKLTKVEGIGPKIEGLLNKAGIVTFADLGATKITVLRTILKDAGSRYQMHDPSTWARQAKMAAKGKWDQLKKLQDELKGGRK